jgi:hypothetical protein
MRRAAAIARALPSACSIGTPKPTMRPSPAMLKTVPSYSNVMSVSNAKNSLSNPTTSTGFSCSEIAVKPRMSANITAARARTCVCPNVKSRSCGSARILSASFGEM